MNRILTASAALGLAFSASSAFAGGHHGAHGPSGVVETAVDASCFQDRRTARVAGGLLGAGVGAAAGRAIAASGVRPEGAILGGIVGAVIGGKVGASAVDCSPRRLYTQGGGRSYGHAMAAPVYTAPLQQAPVYQAPVYQAPVDQAPVYQPPGQAAPAYHTPAHPVVMHQAPVHHHAGTTDWYAPSPVSYYGQERRGPLAPAPAPHARPGQVPAASYVLVPGAAVMQQQTWQWGPVHVPAPVAATPTGHAAPCGQWACH